jgi:hypothetical protein
VAEWFLTFVFDVISPVDPDRVRHFCRFINDNAPATAGPGAVYRYLVVVK